MAKLFIFRFYRRNSDTQLDTYYLFQLSLVLASSCLTLYFISFMYVHFIPYYLASALMGVGFAREFLVNCFFFEKIDITDFHARATAIKK